jgi:hypothetical protein
LLDGEMSESVLFATAPEMLGHLLDRADKEIRRLHEFVGCHGISELLREHFSGIAAVVGGHYRLDQRVQLELANAPIGACANVLNASLHLSRGGDPHSPRGLTFDLVYPRDADDVGVFGGQLQYTITSTANKKGWAGAVEAATLDWTKRRKPVGLPQLCLLIETVSREMTDEFVDGFPQLPRPGRQRDEGDFRMVVFPFRMPSTKSDLKPAVGQDVRGGDIASQQRRIPQRRVEYQGPDSEPFGCGGGRNQGREGRCDSEMINGKYRVVATPFGTLTRIDELLCRINANHVEREPKFFHCDNTAILRRALRSTPLYGDAGGVVQPSVVAQGLWRLDTASRNN